MRFGVLSQLLLFAATMLTAGFLPHPPTDWMVLDVAPALMLTATAFAAFRVRAAGARIGLDASAAFGAAWLGSLLWYAAEAWGHLPPAVGADRILVAGSGPAGGHRASLGARPLSCSMTIFGRAPRMRERWTGESGEALRGTPAARVLRWRPEPGGVQRLG